MDEKKLRHIGTLAGYCAAASVAVGLLIQFGARLALAGRVEGLHFEGIDPLGLIKAIAMMALMGAVTGFLVGVFTDPEGSKKKAGAAGAGDTSANGDDAARETLAKLGIPQEQVSDKTDSSPK